MILFSTMRKLQLANATVYVVEVPACVIKRGAMSNKARDGFDNPEQDLELPAHRDVFATYKAAQLAAAKHDTFAASMRLPPAIITYTRATALDCLTLEPKE